VFGDRCQRSHKGGLKKANASYRNNEGSSDSYEVLVDNGIARSKKRSAGKVEDEDLQNNVQDSLPSAHVLDPIPSEEIDIDEKYAESAVQVSGPSRDDILNPRSHTNVDEENADKETCIFFLESTCRNGSDCDFSHSKFKDTETASGSRLKGPNSSKSYLYSSFFISDHVAHRIAHCSKAFRLITQDGLQTLPSGELPTRKWL
jgi:hypothetical protein